MTYVMSDLHGCDEKYFAMLEKIGLKESDTLYILGDVIDRGPGGIAILQDMRKHKNVIPFLGNHEDMALPVLRLAAGEHLEREIGPAYRAMWRDNGGEPTRKAFLRLVPKKREELVAYLKTFRLREEIEVNGRRFHLSHTLPDLCLWEQAKLCEEEDKEDFLWGEPDYELCYDPALTFITGHTPTGFIDPASRCKIWRRNGHIAIDCGAVFDGGHLGCLCLETMEEYYL